MPIFAGTGSAINFNSSDVTLTHGTDQLILSGGILVITGSNGKLGIQNTAPIAELDVSGKIAISSESSTPGVPAAGKGFLYTKAGGNLYWRSADLTEVNLSDVSSGNILNDADADTRIRTEASADEDKIRFDTAGSERMIITEVGRVGIGTSAPDQPLHVQTNNNNSDPSVLIDNDNAGGTCGIGFRSGVSDNYVIGVAKTGTNFRIANGSNLSTAPSIIDLARDNGGRVGIGTTDPQTKLDVKVRNAEGNLASVDNPTVAVFQRNNGLDEANVSIIGATNGASGLSFGDKDDEDVGKISYDHAANKMSFRVAAVGDRMVIDSSGRVGIAVNDPDQELEVSGAIHISKEQTGDPAAPANGDGGILFTKADGKIYWRSNEVDPAVDLTTGATPALIQDADSDTHIKVEASADADTIVMTSAGSQRMIIANNGNTKFGTGTPTNIFEVYPDSDQTIDLGRMRIHSTTSDTMTLGHFDMGNNNDYALQQDGAGGTKINAKSGQAITFQLNGSNVHSIDSSGRFNIGGGTGIAKLSVAGKIAITTEQTGSPAQPADGNGFLYTKAGGALYWRSFDYGETNLLNAGIVLADGDEDTKITVENASDEDVIRFFTGKTGASEVMTLSGSSSTAYGLGIGTSTPAAQLHIDHHTADTAAAGASYQIFENVNNDQMHIGSKSVSVNITGAGPINVAAFYKAGMVPIAMKIKIVTVLNTGNVGNIGRAGDSNMFGNFATQITSARSAGFTTFAAPEGGVHAFTADENLTIETSTPLGTGELMITLFYHKLL